MIFKEEYTVSEIASIMGVHSETVKRWLRSGKLKGDIENKHYGYLVKAKDFEQFIYSDVKYYRLAEKDKNSAFIEFCKEILVKMNSIEAKMLAEDHGVIWNEGFDSAMDQFNAMIKQMIIEHG